MFFNVAYAAANGAASTPRDSLMGLLPMLIIFMAFMYFFMIRPQNRRTKEHRNLLASLKKGDEVMLTGGIVGKITKLGEQFILIATGEKVEITVQRQSVTQILPKGTLKSL